MEHNFLIRLGRKATVFCSGLIAFFFPLLTLADCRVEHLPSASTGTGNSIDGALISQSFAACDTGDITSITVYMIESAIPASVDVQIGDAIGPVLGPLSTTPQANFSLPTGSSPVLVPVTVPISPPVPVVAGNSYLLQLTTALTGGGEILWASSGANTFADGGVVFIDSTNAVVAAVDDSFFSVLVTTPRPEAVPTTPGIALGILTMLVLIISMGQLIAQRS